MNVGEICSREVHIARPDEPLREAAVLMHRHGVGAIVVVEPRGELAIPIGIVTDRDLVCSQVAQGADLNALRIVDAMTPRPMTVPESASLSEAIRRMSGRSVRRAPVVGESGDLVGIVSLDDLLPAVSEQLLGLARLIGSQARVARHM